MTNSNPPQKDTLNISTLREDLIRMLPFGIYTSKTGHPIMLKPEEVADQIIAKVLDTIEEAMPKRKSEYMASNQMRKSTLYKYKAYNRAIDDMKVKLRGLL